MTKEQIKQQAEIFRDMYKMGVIEREEAKEKVTPYIEMFNKKSKEIAKKYNQKPRTISFAQYCR